MPDVREYQSVVEEAEQAAGAGDFARANARLRDALQLQEATLGTAHPDLASTLNNLAVVCETLGEFDDAERFYRRACAIASGSLPPDDPLVATSRDNLKDFCAARGRPFVEGPGIAPPAPPVEQAPSPVPAPPAVAVPPAASARAASRPAPPAPPVAIAAPAAATWSKPVIGVIAVLAVIGALMLGRSWRTSAPAAEQGAAAATADTSTPATPSTSTAAPAASPTTPPFAPPAPAASAASGPTPPPARAVAPNAPTPSPAAATPPRERSNGNATSVTPAGVRIVAANVCASLSTAGAWRCDAIAAETAPGRAAYYTRIASPSAMRVQHRWYRGTSLRQSVTLSVAANPSAGYRTFSRQTLSPGAWRVELRTAGGAVLHEAAFDVR